MLFVWNIEYVIGLMACYFFITFNLRGNSKYWWLKMIACFAVWTGIWLIRMIPGFQDWQTIFLYISIYVVAVFSTMFIYGTDVVHALFAVAVMGSFQHFVYKLSVAFLCLIDPPLRETNWLLLTELFVLSGTCAVAYFSFGRKMKSPDFYISNVLTFASAGALAIATIVISFYTQETLFAGLAEHKYILALINLLAVLLCAAGLALLYESMIAHTLLQENYILHMLSRKDKERYETAKRAYEGISIKYHDLKHALSERTLDEEEKLELQKTETDYISLMFSGNNALDLILIEKRRLGEEKGVHVQAVVDGSLINFMKAYQIYSMFGNLLDNAIEACEKLEHPEDKVIHLKIAKERGMVVVELNNKAPGAIEFQDGLPKTTKEHKQNHGFGMKSVRSIATKYNGLMQVAVEDGQFRVKILFPFVESTEQNA